MNLRAFYLLFTLEIRKELAYSLDFLVSMILSNVIRIMLSYSLWGSIMVINGSDKIQGMSLSEIVVYYVLIATISNLTIYQCKVKDIMQDIFYGQLNSYLVKPVHYLLIKFIEQNSVAFFFFGLQLLIVLICMRILMGFSQAEWLFFKLIVLLVLGNMFGFCLFALVQCLVFAIDKVESYNLFLRFIVMFFGGFFIPYNFFPSEVQSIMQYTPFPYLMHLPVMICISEPTFHECLRGGIILFMWLFMALIFLLCAWRRGLMHYSGGSV